MEMLPLRRHLRPFPDLRLFPEADDLADVPQQDLRAGGNPDMRYALIGHQNKVPAPANGYKLLLILPGGDGSPDFNPFVRRIAKYALGPDYLAAHLIAPVWSDTQADQLVWPTLAAHLPEAEFSTETFVDAVIADVSTTYALNRRNTFALGWSSGGPPVYSGALSSRALTGAFVAMSVFYPQAE